MSKDYFKDYNRRSEKRRAGKKRSDSGSTFKISRIIAATACFLGVILLSVLAVKLYNKKDEIPDNIATRLKETPTPVSSPVSSAAVKKTPDPTPEPTPEQRKYAVALTFDDGPKSTEEDKDIKGTPALLDTLKKYDAHATFFVVGNRCEIDADILKREIDEGHEIGNHSWNHPQLGKLSMSEVNKQLDDTTDIVKELTGYTISLVRPPYGSVSDEMRKQLKYPMIIWDVDTLDWKINTEDLTLEQKQKKIFKNVKKEVPYFD